MYYSLISSMKKGDAYNPLTTAWISATGETDLTILGALNTLEANGTTNGWLSKMRIMYPIVGGTAIKHKYNFINTATYQLTYASGMTHTSNGMASNGSTGYADTGFANNITAQNSISAGVYMKGSSFGLGLFGSIGASSRTYLYASTVQIYITANNDTHSVVDATRGFWGITRTSSTTRTVVNQTTTFTSAVTSATPSTYNQYINAVNLTGSLYAPSPSTTNISFAFQGDGLTVAELEAMRTDIIAFQTTLGRN